MINDPRWRDIADWRRDIFLMQFYKIVNHEVNVPQESMLILAKG